MVNKNLKTAKQTKKGQYRPRPPIEVNGGLEQEGQ